MSSTLERRAVPVGGLLVGEGPAVVIGGRVSLRARRGQAGAGSVAIEGATLVEPYSADDLPAIAEHADAVVVGASWTRDIPLVRAAAGLGLPVVVERRREASVAEWLELADYCAAEGDGQVILCEGGRPDLGLMRAAKVASGRPVLADVSADVGLSAAAVAAGADGLIVGSPDPALAQGTGAGTASPGAGTGSAGPGPGADRLVAEEAVVLVGALLRDEAPATLPECRQAIDRLDAALATLLERRAELAGIVQRIKPVGGFAGRDLGRERALVARMAVRAPALGEARLAPIMNAVIEAGLHLAEERAAE
ncbi:chorismate mutase type II [Nonomuraea fuscirosea]|uniref:Chorismate mutase type II n=1 Tax=Nonomuraea fuscirosea TaxID=1291556 RepID=A0A2T0MV51_9ACTN|nr:chorismate mutase type II [Nonomuraea fuscirosea]